MASALSFGDSIPGADIIGGFQKFGSSFGTSGQIKGAFDYAGGAVQDLFSSEGSKISAGGSRRAAAGYRRAGELATENLDYLGQSTNLKLLQADRSIYQTISSAEATISGNGLKASGSALDILRDSASQGELTKNIIGLQGNIDANAMKQQIASFGAQADQYDAAAEAADNASTGSMISGAIKGAAAIAQIGMFLSDRRLKTDITRIGERGGLPWYSFRWISDGIPAEGFMADEVRALKPHAVSENEQGYLMVDYNLAGA